MNRYGKKRIITVILFLLLWLLLIIGGSYLLMITRPSTFIHEGYYVLNFKNNFIDVVSKNVEPQKSYVPKVSMAQIDDNHFIFANYNSLFHLDIKKNELTTFKIEGGMESIATLKKCFDNFNSSKELYNPTGIYIDNNGELFVANYKGNNILKGYINKNDNMIKFTKIYSSPKAKGPENVVVANDHDMLLAASYDSGTVTAFQLKTGKVIWEKSIGQAHGICAVKDKVYATSLSERKIYELSIHNGHIIRSYGTLGWNPLKGEFLWPTSIQPYGKELIICDPQTGYFSFIDQETFSTNRYTGGNGPGIYKFHYPYSTLPINNGIIVISSKSDRLFFLDKTGRSVNKILNFKKNNWPKIISNKNYNFADDWKNYINEKAALLTIGGKPYKLGFGQLHPVEMGSILRVPNIGTLFHNCETFIYFLQGMHIEDNSELMFSSSSHRILGVFHKKDKPEILVTDIIPVESWLFGNTLVSFDGSQTPILAISAKLKHKADRIWDELNRNGWLSPKALYKLNQFSDIEYFSKFLKLLDQAFVTTEGRKFKNIYDECVILNRYTSELKKYAINYYQKNTNQNYLNMDEFFLVGMLSGVSQESIKKLNIALKTITASLTYPGFGFENSIDGDPKNNYTAGVENEPGFVVLELDQAKHLSEIKLIWENDVNFARRVIVSLPDNNLKPGKILASSNHLRGPISKIPINYNKPVSRLRIDFTDFSGQPRILLRQIEAIPNYDYIFTN